MTVAGMEMRHFVESLETDCLAAVRGGAYGNHQWDIRVADFTKEQLLVRPSMPMMPRRPYMLIAMQLTMVIEAIYGPCLWFIKLALFVLFLELFGSLKWLRYMAIAGMTVTGLFYFATCIAFAVGCAPKGGQQTQLAYLLALASKECAETHVLVPLTGYVNVFSDIYLILLPLPAVWSLNLPFKKKLSVSAVFLTGLM